MLRTSSNNDIIKNNNSNDIRGGNNGEQERLYYGSERSRGEGSNTESRFGEIQADDDGSNGKVQSDGDFGKRPEMLPNQRNNGRIKLTVEQKESLKGTAIKDENERQENRPHVSWKVRIYAKLLKSMRKIQIY